MPVDVPTIEALAVTLIITAIRTIIEASPTILGGVVVAAWFRTLATPERVKVIFSGEGFQGVLRTAMVSTTLPVCSIGILPVLRELHRLGLSTSKLVTLGLIAPLLNPITVLYGLTVLSATQFLLIAATAGILAIIINDVGSRFAVNSEVTAEPLPKGLTGGTRLRNLLVAAGHIGTGRSLVDMVIVIMVSGLIIALIPEGTFETLCDSSNSRGPVIASLLSLPQYVGPARGAIQCSAIERASLSVPTGLAIYVFGVGLSAGNIILLTRWYGVRRLMAVAVAMFLFICTTVYASALILPSPTGSVDETTGVDGLARSAQATFDQIGEGVRKSLWFTDPLMLVGAAAFWLLVLAGVIVRVAKIGYRDDDPEEVANANTGRMAKAVPASQLGAIAIFGIGIFFWLFTYVFLPSPKECIEEMQAIQMDANIALRGGKVSEALDQIAALDSFAATLPVSAAVRWSFPTPSQRQATRDFRLELFTTRALLQDGDVKSARKKLPDLMRLLTATKKTFEESSS